MLLSEHLLNYKYKQTNERRIDILTDRLDSFPHFLRLSFLLFVSWVSEDFIVFVFFVWRESEYFVRVLAVHAFSVLTITLALTSWRSKVTTVKMIDEHFKFAYDSLSLDNRQLSFLPGRLPLLCTLVLGCAAFLKVTLASLTDFTFSRTHKRYTPNVTSSGSSSSM